MRSATARMGGWVGHRCSHRYNWRHIASMASAAAAPRATVAAGRNRAACRGPLSPKTAVLHHVAALTSACSAPVRRQRMAVVTAAKRGSGGGSQHKQKKKAQRRWGELAPHCKQTHLWNINCCCCCCAAPRRLGNSALLPHCLPTPAPHRSEAEQFEQLMEDWDDAFAADCADPETAAQLAGLAEEGYRKHGRGGCGPVRRGSMRPAQADLQPVAALGGRGQVGGWEASHSCRNISTSFPCVLCTCCNHASQAGQPCFCLPARRLCVCAEPVGAAHPQGCQRRRRRQGLWSGSGQGTVGVCR